MEEGLFQASLMSSLAFLCWISVRRRPSLNICTTFSPRSSFSFISSSSSSSKKHNHQPCKSYITCITCIDRFLLSAVHAKATLAHQSYRLIATDANCADQDSMSAVCKRVLLAAENDPIATKETCSTFIEKLCRTKNLSDAAQLLKGLCDKQIYLSPNAYKVVLIAAAEANDFELSSLAFKGLLITTKSEEPMSYIYVARAFQKVSDLDPLFKLLREILELTFSSTLVINRIIHSFAVSGQTEKALLIFDAMTDLKCKPDTVTYNTVLHILGKVGQLDQMLSVFASMKASECEPDIVTYNTLINNSRKMGRLDFLLRFMQEMIKRGVVPDMRAYTALVDGFGRSGNVEDALKLYSEMNRRQVCPSIYIYRALISNLKKAGKYELARSLLEGMNMHASELVGPKDFRWKNR